MPSCRRGTRRGPAPAPAPSVSADARSGPRRRAAASSARGRLPSSSVSHPSDGYGTAPRGRRADGARWSRRFEQVTAGGRAPDGLHYPSTGYAAGVDPSPGRGPAPTVAQRRSQARYATVEARSIVDAYPRASWIDCAALQPGDCVERGRSRCSSACSSRASSRSAGADRRPGNRRLRRRRRPMTRSSEARRTPPRRPVRARRPRPRPAPTRTP